MGSGKGGSVSRKPECSKQNGSRGWGEGQEHYAAATFTPEPLQIKIAEQNCVSHPQGHGQSMEGAIVVTSSLYEAFKCTGMSFK